MPDYVAKVQVRDNVYELIDREARNDIADLDTAVAGKVPTSRTVNGKALSSNVTINASDVPITTTGTHMTGANVQAAAEDLDTRVFALEMTPPSGMTASYDSTTESLVFSL